MRLRRSPDGPTATERVRRTEFVAHLAPHTSYLGHLATPVHRLAEVVDAAGGMILRYGDSQGLERLVEGLFEGQP